MAQLFSHSNLAIQSIQQVQVGGTEMAVIVVGDPIWNSSHTFIVPWSGAQSLTVGATYTVTVSSP